jgi:hypothetical protein
MIPKMKVLRKSPRNGIIPNRKITSAKEIINVSVRKNASI